MYLHALATAVPPATSTQSECWELAQRSPIGARLKRRSMLILQTILKGDHGIATRHFAAPDLAQVFDLTADQLNAIFRAEAPKLAGRALTAALAQAGLRADQLDALVPVGSAPVDPSHLHSVLSLCAAGLWNALRNAV